jgi:CheY-like chemotaxis protein
MLLLVGEHVHHGRIRNLGRGGALVETSISAPERLLQRSVVIELRLDGSTADWIRLDGRIIRISADAVAVAFDDAPEIFTTLIDDSSTASYAHARILSVVLVDATTTRRELMADVFRRAGCAVIEASQPLEAIVRLGESEFEPDLIAIGDSLPSSTADELRRFVENAHSRAKLVTIGDALDGPEGVAHWLSAADPDSDLATRVTQLLLRPSQ